jgi:hypothetical protein
MIAARFKAGRESGDEVTLLKKNAHLALTVLEAQWIKPEGAGQQAIDSPVEGPAPGQGSPPVRFWARPGPKEAVGTGCGTP